MEKQKVTKGTLIAYWVCAGVWIFNLLIDWVSGEFSAVRIVTHVVCAVVWTLSAVLFTRRYKKEHAEGKENGHEQNKAE